MAGKNSVRIPVALELESDDIVKDYKTTINKISNINDLQSQFKELLKLQKQYIDNAKASSDPMMKALNLQGVKAYSEILGRIQSQVEKIDKTKMSDFSLPKFQFDDKEIINNVKNIDKLVKSVVSDIESIGRSSSIKDLGSMFKGIGSDSIKNFYKERVELSAETVKSQLKNDKLSMESIEKLLDVMQQYEVFNKKILKKNGTISTNIADILPRDLLKNEKLFKNISLDNLQIRWNKITTPDIVDNVRSAIIGNLSSRAMNKPLYIPTDGLIMSSDVANDFGEYQKKIDAAKTSLKELGKEFMQLNENVDSTNLEFKTKEGKDDIEQMNKYLDMAFQIKSAIQDIKSMSSVIGIDSKTAIKLSDFGLAGFDDIYKNILGKSNSNLAMKYLDEISASISDIYNKTMGNIGDDSEQVLKSKLSQINKMITLTTNSSLINDTNLTDEFDEIIGKENSLNLVLSQRQKIMAELEKKGYKLSENEIQANSATLEAEQIRKGFMPKFGQNANGGSGVSAGSSNVDESIVNEIKIAIDDLNKRVSILETDMPDNTKSAIEEIKSDITKIQKSLKEQMTAYIDSKTLRDAHSYVNEINAVLNTLKSNDEITTMQNKFKELTSTVYGLTDALSKMYGEQFKINTLAGSPRYLTEENGNEKVWYRGVNGMMGNGLFSSGYNGAVFYTDNVEVASKAYAGSDGKGKIEKAKIIANKTWEIDGNKSSWREIEYLGNGEDELSERISLASARMEAQLKELSSIVNISKIFDISSFKPITPQFQDVAKIFDQLITNTNQTLKADQIEKIKQIKQVFEKNRDEYIKISNDDSNPYGIHDTDTYVKYAQSMKNPDGSNKYDSIVFKNIYDGVSKTSDQLSTVAVTLGEAQSQYIETLSAEGSKVEKISSTYASSLNENESKVFDQIRMLTDKVTELENKGVKANDGDIKAVTEDVAKLSEQLNNISKTISSDSTSNIKDQLQPLVDTVNKLGNLEGISSVKDKFKQLDDQIIAINQNLSLMESKINNIKPTPVLSIPTTPNNIVSEPSQNNNTNDNIINDNITNDKLPEQIDYYKQLVDVVTRYNELEAKHIINGSKEEKYYDSRINRQEKLKELYKNINDLITQGNLLNDNRLNDITISDHNKSISVSDISNWNVDYDRKIKDLQTKQSNDIKTLLNNVNKYEQGLNEMVRDGQVSANNQKSLSEIIIALEMSLDIIKQNSSKDDNQKYEQKISGIIEKAKSITVKNTKPKSTKSSIKETTNTKSNYLQEQLGRKDKSDTESLEISKLQSQINALQNDRENQKKKNRELTKEISALKSATDTTEVKSKQLAKQAELDKLRREMDSRNNEILFLQKQIDALKQNMTVYSPVTNSSNPSKRPQTSINTTADITAAVKAASEASTAEAKAFKTIDKAVKDLTRDINTKTEAIRAEATEMTNAAKSEVASISQIKQAFVELTAQIQNVPKVKIVGENDGKLNISANLTEEQIAVIREKLKAAFSSEQAIPISFVPNVEGLKQQIADALKDVPVEITNNNINKVIKVNKFKANSDGVETLRNSISSQLKNVKIQSFDATTAAESVKETLSKVLDGVGLKFDTEKLGNEVREAVNSGVEAASAEQKPEASDNKAVRFKEKATNDIGKLRDKYTDKLQGQQLEVFKERLNEIDNKIKEIKDDASNYTDENAQVIDKDIKQIEALVNSFKEINNSEDKINSLIQKLKDSKNNIERRGAVAQPVVNNINSEMSALEELKRSGQNLNVGNPAEVQAFIDKLHEADATVESLQQSAKDIRVSTNTTASVAKLDSKFNDLLFKVDKFRRDNSKITSDKGISAQFDSLMRSIQTIEKSDVNFQRLRAQFDQLKATVQGKGLTGRSLGDELKYIAEKIGIKAMLGNSIYRVIGAFRQMVGIVTELDTGMTTLKRVTEETEATYRKFLKTAGDEAHELGSTVSGLVDSTGDFARLGYNIQEANALAKNAVMYSNVGWLDIQTATADMTSTMKAFNIEASDSIRIVDTFDILGKKLPLVTISVKGWRHSRPSKDIVNHNICVTTAGGVW